MVLAHRTRFARHSTTHYEKVRRDSVAGRTKWQSNHESRTGVGVGHRNIAPTFVDQPRHDGQPKTCSTAVTAAMFIASHKPLKDFRSIRWINTRAVIAYPQLCPPTIHQ
jgi:hypothetical protein